ncbi:DUF4199 domain-containing protein [Flavobacterium litorale]|uniref:DUF4199 domain-containing protein n=1 Tax=Flavobacterium litorale TaxID=2856519 RepID=A0ABX8VAZ9_9FLAO|nr:DUF4199 domain-containing protein [Flavobacterium litorale]QYJ68211.1 DUF4199 domain-containing protein [Flavobacterium litorale]
MKEAIKKNGINFGIIIGVVSILISTLLYIIDLELMVSIWVGIIIFLVSLGIGIFAVAKSKKELGGFISFKEAFTVFFISMAISAAISNLFMYGLFNFVDPDAKAELSELVIKKTVTMMQDMGAPSDSIKETAKQLKETDNFSPLSLLKSYVGGLVFHIIIGLIVAAAMKKNKPEFEN